MKKLKQRLPRFQRPGHHPSIEKNRTWHDPVVEIYESIAASSEASRTSVRAYDVANRRWYHLEVDAVANEEWMAGVVEKHIRAYYKGHRRQPRWNTIKTTLRGTPVAYETQEEDVVCHQLTESLAYGGKPEDRFPTVPWREVRDKSYLSKGADHCRWDGRQCVFKRIEFDVDVPAFERAIRNREKLITSLESEGDGESGGAQASGTAADVSIEMERRFNVVPIHAVVIKDEDPGPWRKGSVAGILMPFAGSSLDALAERGQLNVTEAQLLDLLSGIRELNRFDVSHGDICDWNVALQPSLDLSGRGVGAGRLLLLDLGNVAPDYEGDAKLLGRLFLWCLQHSANLHGDAAVKLRVEEAAFLLKTREDLDLAYVKLAEGSVAQEKQETQTEGGPRGEGVAEDKRGAEAGVEGGQDFDESPGHHRT